jgi:hypothetical protein
VYAAVPDVRIRSKEETEMEELERDIERLARKIGWLEKQILGQKGREGEGSSSDGYLIM